MFVVGAWFFAHTAAHIHERFEIWLDPFKDAGGSGYQISQSLFAQADGGLFGRGLGDSLVQLPGRHPLRQRHGLRDPARAAHGLHLRRDRG